ncbi:MAG: hypothetical protein NT003_03245 [Candidatus Magasanikbacteria bacterium]|nr:hypothetical protein [Candidatus Magasanikbacteria bacterium]
MRSSAAEKLQKPTAVQSEKPQKKQEAASSIGPEKFLKAQLAVNESALKLLLKEIDRTGETVKENQASLAEERSLGSVDDEKSAGLLAAITADRTHVINSLQKLLQTYRERDTLLEDAQEKGLLKDPNELVAVKGAMEKADAKLHSVQDEQRASDVREALHTRDLSKMMPDISPADAPAAVAPKMEEPKPQFAPYKPSPGSFTRTAGEINAEADEALVRAQRIAKQDAQFEATDELHRMTPAEVTDAEKLASNVVIDKLEKKEPIRSPESYEAEQQRNEKEMEAIKLDLFTKFSGCVDFEYSGKLKMINKNLLTPNQVWSVQQGVKRFNELKDIEVELVNKFVPAERFSGSRKVAGFANAGAKGSVERSNMVAVEDPFAAAAAELADTRNTMKKLETKDEFLTAAIAGGRVTKDPLKNEYKLVKSGLGRFVSFVIGKNDNEKAIDSVVAEYNKLAQDERDLVNEVESLRVAGAPEVVYGPQTAEAQTLAFLEASKKRQEKRAIQSRPLDIGGPGGLVR